MEKMAKKGMAALVGLALVSAAGLAQAETRFAVQDTVGNDKMVVTDRGFVGVGTNAPKTAVHTSGNSIDTTQIISHYTGTEPLAAGGFLAYRNNLNGTTPILPKANDRIGYMLFGANGANNAPRNAAGLVSHAEADWTATSMPAYFLFETAAPNSGGRTERMRITAAGNVGVGTSTPTQRLEVNGALRLNTTAQRPADCTAALRGVIYVNQAGTGTADTLSVCLRDANGNFNWVNVTP